MIEFTEQTLVEGGVETTTVKAITPRAVAWVDMHGAEAIVARANLLATPGARIEHLFQHLIEQDLGPAAWRGRTASPFVVRAKHC